MQFALWSAVVGLLLVVMALSQSVLSRLPLSTSMLYLLAGVAVSPLVLGLSHIAPLEHVKPLEHMAEVIVLLSLFTSGMKMSVGLKDGRWVLPLRLAVVSMAATVAAVTVVAVWLLDLPLGAGVLLGAILAPTDPVLAADVHVAEASDRDRLRFSLTGEAGLNDGTAFPFVMLGLGLLGLHDLGAAGWRWMAVDVVWATACGLFVGAVLGSGVGKLVLYLRRRHKEAVGLDNFLALGLIALAYGGAVLAHGYGFLAVFAAGVALRRVEQHETSIAARASATSRLTKAISAAMGGRRRAVAAAVPKVATSPASPKAGANAAAGSRLGPAADTAAAAPQDRSSAVDPPADVAVLALADPDLSKVEEVATHPQHAPAFMAHAVLSFNEQIERIGEVAGVLMIGMLLWAVEWQHAAWWFAPLLLLLIRPLSVTIGLAHSKTSRTQRALIGWFGIRGIGSLYYLMYAIGHGIDSALADTLMALTLTAVVVSITAHGISVTPLMAFYERAQGRPSRKR
jgi:NhaP-type Na+/H+ or K+/H+ antiporter